LHENRNKKDQAKWFYCEHPSLRIPNRKREEKGSGPQSYIFVEDASKGFESMEGINKSRARLGESVKQKEKNVGGE
jgi:hypothetical protein